MSSAPEITTTEKSTFTAINTTHERRSDDDSLSSPTQLTEKQVLEEVLDEPLGGDAPARAGANLAADLAKGSGAETVTAAGDEDEDMTVYPPKLQLIAITIGLCLAVFCVAIDNTIISVAIPRITDQFHSFDDVGWYASAYLLTTAALQLFYGKLFTYFNIKYVYLSALFLFELGSLVCGVAPNSIALIIGRAIAGLGCAGLFSGAILIITFSVPLQQRPTFNGLFAGMYAIASVAGPLMGGAFTDKLTWRWCFYINLPIGGVTAAFLVFFYHSPPISRHARELTFKQKLASMDLEGTIIFIPAIICLLLALQWGGYTYHWGNWRIIFLFIMFGVLISVFVGIQIWKGDKATVPPRVFKKRSVFGAALFICFLSASFFVLIYYIPIFFQAIDNTSPVNAGVRLIPMVLSVTLFSMAAGIFATITGNFAQLILVSSVLMSIGVGLISTWNVETGSGKWIGYQIIAGAGCGFGLQLPIIAVQACIPAKDIPVGTSIIIFSQVLGGALFASVGQNVLSNQLIENAKIYAPSVTLKTIQDSGATTIRQYVSASQLPGFLIAYAKALDETFYVAVATAALSIIPALFIEWRNLKKAGAAAGSAPAA